MEQLTSSVIICTRNRPDDVHKFLISLRQQTQLPTELIIVDSSDTPLEHNHDFKKIFVSDFFSLTKLKYVHTKPGLPYQRNVGIEHATGDVLYFFDDDVKLKPNYLAAMQTIFMQQTEYSGGMGSVENIPAPAKLWCRIVRRIFLLGRSYDIGIFTWSGMPAHTYGTRTMRDVQVLGGCCMAYRSFVFKRHRFDEKLGGYAYMEDCDFSRRVSLKGKLFFNPAAQLYHYHSPVSRDKVVANRAMFIHNYSYLFFKNFYPYNKFKIVFYWWSVLGLFIEAVLYRRLEYVKGYWQGLRKYYKQY